MELTKDLSTMPDIEDLHRICKGIAALETVLCRNPQFRYYFYDPDWDDQQEVFQLINGCGSVRSGCSSHMIILFCPDGCVINGFDNQSYDNEMTWVCDEEGDIHPQKSPDKEKKNALKMEAVKQGLPEVFHQFMYGETVKRMKTTFCIWKTKNGVWSRSDMAGAYKDGSVEMLDILDKNPQKYIEFCQWYYNKNIPLNIAEKVYQGEPFTAEMINGLNNEITDIEPVINELHKMRYPYLLSENAFDKTNSTIKSPSTGKSGTLGFMRAVRRPSCTEDDTQVKEEGQLQIPSYLQGEEKVESLSGKVRLKDTCTDSTQSKEEIERMPAIPDGKEICNTLREQRIRLAMANHIPFQSEDCPSTESCAGTCEKCDAESDYLREQLQKIPKEKRIYPQFDPEGETQA